MHSNKTTWIALFLFSSILTIAQQSLTQESYYEWKRFSEVSLSSDGSYLMYIQSVEKGNAQLILRDNEKGTEMRFDRVSDASFSSDGEYLAMTVIADYDSTRALKLAEAKKSEFPPDTLVIMQLADGSKDTIVGVNRYEFAEKKPHLLVYQYEIPKVVEDEEELDSADVALDSSATPVDSTGLELPERGKILVVYNVKTEERQEWDRVESYFVPERPEWIFTQFEEEDTTHASGYYGIRLSDYQLFPLDTGAEDYTGIAFDSTGVKAAFYKTEDAEEKDYDRSYSLVIVENGQRIHQIDSGAVRDYIIHPKSRIYFDREREGMYFGMQEPPPFFPTDTTILDEERVSVDIWNWKDGYIQPYQEENAGRFASRSFLVYMSWKKKELIPYANPEVPSAVPYTDTPGDFTLASDESKYLAEQSWTYPWRTDYYSVNRKTGEQKLIVEATGGYLRLSPAGKYAYWYEPFDSTWNIYNLKKEQKIVVEHPEGFGFFDRENDVPSPAYQYGEMGWTKGDEAFWIYDEFDIYQIDPTGSEKPINATGNYGRQNNLQIRFSEYDRDRDFFNPGENLYLTIFNTETKSSGYAKWTGKGAPEVLILDEFEFGRLRRADSSDVFVYTVENFQTYPNLHLAYSQPSAEDPRVTDLNPQQSEYAWGSVEMISWRNLRGEVLRGLLYKPANFDSTKKYPMITYFYEKYTDRLHSYYTPAPSRSIVNFSYLTSNGYVVFVPDITYTVGHPGKDAYDCIVPGVNAVVEMGFVDDQKIGIQGQSWGGYQTAFLVTQTDMFAAGFAGAPVSNMTSAYGGIRWGSGLNRAFQYEAGQSRIGFNLWERPEWYIENSPLFFADRVNTPLLIMHNDNDGAVPWYQGIEYFMALRRLGKPTWLLVYNGEEHNLMQWHNRMDLDKRMYQFFDHYLKDQPAPKWLIDGVPYQYKKKDYGFELLDD